MNELNEAINNFLNYYVHDGDRDEAMQELQKLVANAYGYGQKTALKRVSDFVKNI